MAFDTFVFDLDGTLLDTLPDLVVITNQALGELGFPPRSHDEILSYVGNGVRALMCQAVPEGTSSEQTDAAMEHWKALFPGYGNNLTKPYPHMRETLASSARGARMGVLSNKFDAGVQQVMNQFMPGTFAVMHGECDGIPRKPDPAGLLRTIEELAPPPPARPTWATPPATSRSRRMPARSPSASRGAITTPTNCVRRRPTW